MPKKMLIDATHAEETRVVVVDGNKVEEFDFESENRRQLAGNIYLARVTRVEPSLQAAFIEYGGNRHGFLAFAEVHPDYYQIPVADREALMAEEAAAAARDDAEDEAPRRKTQRSRPRSRAAATSSDDARVTRDIDASTVPTSGDVTENAHDSDVEAMARTAAIVENIPGMDVVDLASDDDRDADDGDTYGGDVTDAGDRDDGDDDDGNGGDRQHADTRRRSTGDDARAPYRAMDDAAERDDEIESVGREDPAEEVQRPRRTPARKYKIQEVIKVRQILLVQVVKEERGNKGAALTTYLSLAGRYCVLMPNTARGGGISRKITNVVDRKKLKEIAQSIDVPKGAGLIVRTAGAKRTKTEIKRDYEYLQRMWEQIRELTLRSIAPAPIYQEGDLIKRSIRDLYNRDIDEVLVEGEEGYRSAKDFMKMIMPSHAKNVKHYHDQMPLFARHQVESYLSSMFNPTVQLPSGGYIVIGVTEALVAIDVNSGRATKEGSIEETATKTNLEAAAEVARQLRLRDLAGLIVIDFIDMEDRRNNAAVEKLFKDRLKTDRARIQVGRISAFGLMEMSRQRLHPGMIEATTTPCKHCHGTGLLRSDDSLSLGILRQLEEEGVRDRTREVLVHAPVGIANYLMNHKRDRIAVIEARYGMAVRVEGDPSLVSPDYSIEKFKEQTTRVVRQTAAISSNPALMDDPEDDDVDADVADNLPGGADAEVEEVDDEATAPAAAPALVDGPSEEDGQSRKRRRRRRRRKGAADAGETEAERDQDDATVRHGGDADDDKVADTDREDRGDGPPAAVDDRPRRRRSRSRRPVDVAVARDRVADAPGTDGTPDRAPEPVAAAPAARDASAVDTIASEPAAEPALSTLEMPPAAAPPVETPAEILAPVSAVPPSAPATPQPDPAEAEPEADDDKPKKRGWWSLRR